MRKYTKREAKEYNKFRTFFQWFVANCIYGLYFKIMYRLEIQGRENIPKDKKFIVAANHMSAADPFLTIVATQKPTAYMAKEDLFHSNFLMTLFLDWLGAFAVNRDKLDVSTIKTALAIKNSKWDLGLFPQGTRVLNGKIENISRGFAALAKTTKTDILPIAIIGADKKTKIPFTGKVILKIGLPISVSDDINEMVDKWCEAISELTGFEYVKECANQTK